MVRIEATRPDVVEVGAPQRGVFRLHRTGDLSQPATVYLTLSGTGANRIGTDYQIPESDAQLVGNFYVATFAVGQESIRIHVRAAGTPSPVAPETITLTVDKDQATTALYDPSDTSNSATVTLSNG